MDKERFFYFDGLRGLAVLIVWLSHSSGRDQYLLEFLNFHGIGHVGVMLFFSLSGYLLVLSYLKSNDSYFSYIIKRYFRIAPLYYIVIFLVIVYQAFYGQNYRYLYIVDDVYSKFLLFSADGIFWTIPVEFFFYLFLPFVVFLYFKNKVSVVFFGGFFSFIYFLAYLFNEFKVFYFDLVFLDIEKLSQFFDVFFVGALFALLSEERGVIKFYEKHRAMLEVTIFYLFLFTIIFLVLCVSRNFLSFKFEFYSFRYLSFYFAFVFSVVIFSCQQGNVFFKWLAFKPLVFIGKVGYSWYLLHMGVLWIVNDFLILNNAIKFMVSSTLLVCLSYLSYRFIEVPFIIFGRRMAKKYSGRRKNCDYK
ncbi:acyltransferase family protein [Marinomonas sp. TW1]|uniref:acyltransferase family protein n=1 Tax=Marinomonas sp. TW1 TaxID=1561203 RepID=UPI0018D338E0|nr:acyltransferase [Marinomonas sp. TW1]